MSPASRVVRYMLAYRRRYVGGIACLVVATGFALGIPWTVKRAVDAIAAGVDQAGLARFAGLIVFLALAHGVARFASRAAMIGAGQWVEHDLRRDLYEHLQRLPPAVHQRHRTGDLMARATSDVSAVRALSGFGATMLVQTSLAFGGALIAMSLIDPWLTALALAPSPVLIAIATRLSHAVEVQSAGVQDQIGVLAARVQDNLAGMPVVRAYTMETREIAGFRRLNDEFLVRSLRLARTQAIAWPFMGLIAGAGTLVVLWMGGRAVIDGRITLGAFVAFNGYVAYLAWPTIALGWTLANVRRGLASMRRVAEILDEVPGEGASAAAAFDPDAAAPRVDGAIEFAELTFAYAGRDPALSEVSFRVPEGGLVAVVGPTGSGKSTLGLLLCRLFEPPPGAVRIGGRDVRDVPLGALRRAVAYVPQEPFLFSRSIRDNLAFADARGGGERLAAAARTAGIAEEIERFPAGWDTVVGERGLTLSGGQRQRATLARALVADPAILFLDDPFASVDPGKEAEILAAIRAARRGRTTLLATHRLRAAHEADWVVMLDRGVLVEQGRPADLLGAGGVYARFWRIQQIEDELGRPDGDPGDAAVRRDGGHGGGRVRP